MQVPQKEITSMATMNVSLPAPMKAWVEERSADGRYSNSSDYVRDLIRKDQERAGALAEIQALIDQGLTSGAPKPFDKAAFLQRMRHEHDRAS
jgi:antitoxin ParD1/3/4